MALPLLLALALPARAEELDAAGYLREAQSLYRAGQYFKAARYAFAAQEKDRKLGAEADSWTTLALVKGGLFNSAAYFFIKTIQAGDKAATRRVLGSTQELLVRVGGDLLRKYLIRHTVYEDYDELNRSAYLYVLGKEALLSGQEEKAVGYLNAVSPSSPLWAFSLQLRGSALAILGRVGDAIGDFRSCAGAARQAQKGKGPEAAEAEDLEARCLAGEARTLYQADRFEDADRAYDRIPKESFVWPDILFEQAWNAFARQEYNRTLGKLVSYKSPALRFVFNSEVDVLRAQSFLALCLYSDANEVINEFNQKYAKVGDEVKRFVESKATDLPALFQKGKDALQDSLYSSSDFHRMLDRFVRGPYFQGLVAAEKSISAEQGAIARFDQSQPGVDHRGTSGFPGFLGQVLSWRLKSIRTLGGAFVKNSLLDHHSILISDFEKMAFIKLEMLSRAKQQLLYPKPLGERVRGAIEPTRRDYQYYWSFNGEFWNDELGDYVFGLESECRS